MHNTPNTLKAHYDLLKETNKDQWNELNAELARRDFLNHFQRRILPFEDYDLREAPSWTRTCIIKYLPGFTNEHFDTNTMPQLLAEDAA